MSEESKRSTAMRPLPQTPPPKGSVSVAQSSGLLTAAVRPNGTPPTTKASQPPQPRVGSVNPIDISFPPKPEGVAPRPPLESSTVSRSAATIQMSRATRRSDVGGSPAAAGSSSSSRPGDDFILGVEDSELVGLREIYHKGKPGLLSRRYLPVRMLEAYQYSNPLAPTHLELCIPKILETRAHSTVDLGYRYYTHPQGRGSTREPFCDLILDGDEGQLCGENPLMIFDIMREHFRAIEGFNISGPGQRSLFILTIAKEMTAASGLYFVSPGFGLQAGMFFYDERFIDAMIPGKICRHTMFNHKHQEFAHMSTSTNFGAYVLEFISKHPRKTLIAPFSVDGHITRIMRLPDGRLYIFDSSLHHCEKERGVFRDVSSDLFGNFTGTIAPLSKHHIQTNGTCAFWANGLDMVLASNPVFYGNPGNIIEEFRTGLMQFRIAAQVGRELDQIQPMITIFRTGERTPPNCVTFTIGGTAVGISRNCHNNRYANIEGLVNGISDETTREIVRRELAPQIALQKEIIKAQRILYFLRKTEFNVSKIREAIGKASKAEAGGVQNHANTPIDFGQMSQYGAFRGESTYGQFIERCSSLVSEVRGSEQQLRDYIVALSNFTNTTAVGEANRLGTEVNNFLGRLGDLPERLGACYKATKYAAFHAGKTLLRGVDAEEYFESLDSNENAGSARPRSGYYPAM